MIREFICIARKTVTNQRHRLRYFGERNMPNIDYPDGFQGTQIPVFGPTVAKLIEDRVAGLA
jgi:hypothetical protein